VSKILNIIPKIVSKCLHAVGKIHKEGIWVVRKCHFESFVYGDFFISQAKKKVFCGVSWLAMKNGFILIIPSGRNHELIPANHPLQRRKGIFTDIRPCSVFGRRRVCYTMNSCVQMKLLQLPTAIMPIEYELMQERSFVANNWRKVILLHDNARPLVAKSVKQILL